MVITGSALLVKPGSLATVLGELERFPQVTFHVQSESGTELVVTVEASDCEELEVLCNHLKSDIPDIVDVTHVYVNFEDEITRLEALKIDDSLESEPIFSPKSGH